MSTINVLSVNVRGLRQKQKRLSIFDRLKRSESGEKCFIFMQETHSTPEIESLWESEWGNKIYYNHGTSGSSGTLIIVPRSHDYKIDLLYKDGAGRIMILKVQSDCESFFVVNIIEMENPRSQTRVISSPVNYRLCLKIGLNFSCMSVA